MSVENEGVHAHIDSLKHRMCRIEQVSDKLQNDVETIRRDQADDRERHAREYGELRLTVSKTLPEALRAVPKEFEEERQRQLREREVRIEQLDHNVNRRILKWTIIASLISGLSVGLALLAYFNVHEIIR